MPIGGGTAKTLVPRKLVTSVRFSPDGRFVVAATADGRCASGALPAGASWRVAPASARIFRRAPRSATTDGFSSQGVIRVGETGSGASLTDGWPGVDEARRRRRPDRARRECTRRRRSNGSLGSSPTRLSIPSPISQPLYLRPPGKALCRDGQRGRHDGRRGAGRWAAEAAGRRSSASGAESRRRSWCGRGALAAIRDIYGDEPGVILADSAAARPSAATAASSPAQTRTRRRAGLSAEERRAPAEPPPQPPRFPGEVMNDLYPLPSRSRLAGRDRHSEPGAQ